MHTNPTSANDIEFVINTEEYADEHSSVLSFSEETMARQLSKLENWSLSYGAEKKQGRVPVSKPIQFDITDCESREEKCAYRFIATHVDVLVAPDAKAESKVKAAHWIFGRYNHPLNFSHCATVLGSDSDTIRLLAQKSMWQNCIRADFSELFPFSRLPEELLEEAETVAGMEGISIVTEAWYHPGIDARDLVFIASGEDDQEVATFELALNKLIERKIVSTVGLACWATGKNPDALVSVVYENQEVEDSWLEERFFKPAVSVVEIVESVQAEVATIEVGSNILPLFPELQIAEGKQKSAAKQSAKVVLFPRPAPVQLLLWPEGEDSHRSAEVIQLVETIDAPTCNVKTKSAGKAGVVVPIAAWSRGRKPIAQLDAGTWLLVGNGIAQYQVELHGARDGPINSCQNFFRGGSP